MKDLGMIGFGRTYEWFFKMRDFQDDEVALLHAPAPFYYPHSEPLVHMRECVDDLINQNLLAEEVGTNVINEMKAMYFGNRTLKRFLDLISKMSNLNTSELEKNFDQYRIKQLDLLNFLNTRRWMDTVQ